MKFFQGLRNSASREVQVLSRLVARDRQSVTGKNISLIRELTKLNPWNTSSAKVKFALQVHEAVDVPDLDQWRLPYLVTLLKQRGEAYYQSNEEQEKRLTELIESLVIN